MRIVLTGGGTGGHVLPFGALISALREQFAVTHDRLPGRLAPKELSLVFMGVADERAREFFTAHGVRVVHIPSGKLRRYASGMTIIDLLFRLPVGIVKALLRMYLEMPDVVVSLGGYGSIPSVLAAAFYRIPVLLHAPDAVLGLANKKLARYAAAVSLGFEATRADLRTQAYKGVLTGTAVREDVQRFTREEARKQFGIATNEHVLLVIGGSQGAKQLNEVLLQILPKLVVDVTVLHVTGRDHFRAVSTVAEELLKQSSRKDAYQPFAYLTEQMAPALVAADSIVARAGASSLAEIAALRKPTLLVPLANSAQDHQRANAQVFETSGAALVLDPTNLTPNLFASNVQRLIHDAEARAHMAANLAALDHPRAAQEMADLTLKLAQGFAPKKP